MCNRGITSTVTSLAPRVHYVCVGSSQTYNPSSLNMPDPIRKRFRDDRFSPLRPACSQNRAGSYNYAGSDFPHPFQIIIYLFFNFKEGKDHIVQNRPGSDLDGLVRVWPNASGPKASRCAGIIWLSFWQDPTGLEPVSHLQIRFCSSTDIPDNTVQKPARMRCSSG